MALSMCLDGHDYQYRSMLCDRVFFLRIGGFVGQSTVIDVPRGGKSCPILDSEKCLSPTNAKPKQIVPTRHGSAYHPMKGGCIRQDDIP